MRFSIKRDGKTVCIGHCTDYDEPNEQVLNRLVREIGRRLRLNDPKYDDGITYRADSMGDFETFDEIVLKFPHQVVTVMFGFPVAAAQTRPTRETD